MAFLAVYVLLTFYKQLTEVMVLNRTAAIMEYSQDDRTTLRRTNTAAGDFNEKLFDHSFQSKRRPNNEPDFGTENIHFTGDKFKNDVGEKVFAVRRNFYVKLNPEVADSRAGSMWTLQDAKTRSWRIVSANSMQSRAGQNHAGQNHAGRNHAGQTHAGRNHAGRNHAGQNHAGHPRDSRETRANVMILAYLRSGSSFLGELFNRNPNVFYLFEPLYPIATFLEGKRRFSQLYDAFVRHFLGNIFACSFNKHPFFVNFLAASRFRLKSRGISSPVFCDPRVTSTKMHLCRRINTTLQTRLCRSSSHTVVKTIRVSNWETIDAITETSLTKLIHLVRDPRAIITSRVSHLLAEIEREKARNAEHAGNGTAIQALATNIRSSSTSLCDTMRNDIFNGKKRTAFGKTYALVRYEDVARHPLGAYEEIYDFTGIAQSDHVVKWLEVNTISNSNPYYYSTSRNSSAAARMWRLRLPMTLVAEVQKQCSDVMRILGYTTVRSDAELRDMSKSLVVEWDNEGLLRTNVAV